MSDRRCELRIATWNVHGSVRPDLADLAATIDALDIDVIGLQEVRRHQARYLSRSLGLHGIWTFEHNGYSRLLPYLAEGLAILSRWTLDHDGDIELGGPRSRSDHRRRVATWATVAHPVGNFVLANTDLGSRGDEQQTSQLATLIAAGFPCHAHDRHDPLPTIVTGGPGVPVSVTDDWETLAVAEPNDARLRLTPSDHLPVIATIQMRSK